MPKANRQNTASEMERHLTPRLYGELLRIATLRLSRERSDHTLEPAALVHEAFLRLVPQNGSIWQDQPRLKATANRMMSRVLVDHARRRSAAKRGGRAIRVVLSEESLPGRGISTTVTALANALERLAELDSEAEGIVSMRYFGGLSVREVAEVLDRSPRSVARKWRFARTWLLRELQKDEVRR